jgi:hypothetical protein
MSETEQVKIGLTACAVGSAAIVIGTPLSAQWNNSQGMARRGIETL